MLDGEFCTYVEYEITKALNATNDAHLKGFWCDGVLLPDNESDYSKKVVNEKAYVVMTAFAGKTGQDKYELTLRFGSMALIRYANNLRIEACIPTADENAWLKIDPLHKKIVVQLD